MYVFLTLVDKRGHSADIQISRSTYLKNLSNLILNTNTQRSYRSSQSYLRSSSLLQIYRHVCTGCLEESQTNDVALSTLPLAAVSSVLTALDADKEDAQLGPGGARALDTAGYESVSFCPS